MNHLTALFDAQFLVYTVVALVPNLLIILFALARLSHEVRLLKQKNAMLETDIEMLDQGMKSLTEELQSLRQAEIHKTPGQLTPAPVPLPVTDKRR